MPETIGLLILSATSATAAGTGIAGLGTLAGTTIAGVSVATVVGSAAIIGVSIGLQYALNNPEVPKPEGGAIPLKQSIPVRRRGYWINRMSGHYMLYIAAGANSQDMVAFHSGRIEEVLQVYLHDQPVTVSPDPTHGAVTSVATVGADQFDGMYIQVFYGLDSQNSCSLLDPTSTSGEWTTAHAGRGIACLAQFCQAAPDPETYSRRFRQGLPLPSVVAKLAPVWDPRDPAQSRFDRSTWRASPNPVLQLIDYLTEPDGGMGEDLDDILPPAALALWMEEADLCEGRYDSAGWYQFDNSPESVIGKILSTCDGWLCESSDGTLSLTVGVYREPTDVPLSGANILGYSVARGIADEEVVNQLDVTITSPAAGYVSEQIASVRDEDSISLLGQVRAKQLDLSWVQDEFQADLLAQRAMLRLNARSGTLVTDLYGLNYLGKRWIPVDFPTVRGLENAVVEIQDRAEVDLLNGRITFKWKLIDRAALIELGSGHPALLREDLSTYRREDGSSYVREQ